MELAEAAIEFEERADRYTDAGDRDLADLCRQVARCALDAAFASDEGEIWRAKYTVDVLCDKIERHGSERYGA